MSARRVLFAGVLLVLGLGSCTERPTFQAAELERLRTIGAAVDTERLMDTVRGVVAAHQSDTPYDCGALPSEAQPRLCHLTSTKAREYLRGELRSLGYEVHEQVETEVDPAWPTVNLVAELRGTTKPDELVIIAAHYDAFYAGADDNTSGVAGVLEAARVLRAHRFERTVRFVLFDLEEIGLVGSTRYTKSLPPNEKVVFALILECIGYSDDSPGSQRVPLGFSSSDVGDFIAVIGNDASERRVLELAELNELLGLSKISAVLSPGKGDAPFAGDLLRSDHAPFWHEGHPALFLTDTANFRNPNYHLASDTVDTLDPAFMTGVVRLATASVAYWAGVR